MAVTTLATGLALVAALLDLLRMVRGGSIEAYMRKAMLMSFDELRALTGYPTCKDAMTALREYGRRGRFQAENGQWHFIINTHYSGNRPHGPQLGDFEILPIIVE